MLSSPHVLHSNAVSLVKGTESEKNSKADALQIVLMCVTRFSQCAIVLEERDRSSSSECVNLASVL